MRFNFPKLVVFLVNKINTNSVNHKLFLQLSQISFCTSNYHSLYRKNVLNCFQLSVRIPKLISYRQDNVSISLNFILFFVIRFTTE